MIHGTPQIFHNVRGIFIHIPKCAGTSIEKTLGGQEFGGHSTVKGIREKYPMEWNQYYKFTIVRDPLTRFASGYHYLKQRVSNNALQNDKILLSRDINDYIQNYFLEDNVLHLWKQMDFISEGGRILVDTYPYEELEKSWRTILMKLNQHYKPLPLMNKSKDYTISYDSSSLKILYDYYKWDFEELGY
jgi:hypothetical protein